MEENSQNLTIQKQDQQIDPYKKQAFDAFITFLALGGLVTTDDGKVQSMTQEKFCEAYGITRTTTLEWKKNTPNLAELIRARREEIVPLSRETKAWNQLYLLGMQTQDKRAAVDALKTFLGHFAKLRLPSQTVEHEVGNSFADLINTHRQEQRKIIDVTPND